MTIALLALLVTQVASAGTVAAQNRDAPWQGQWHTFWRGGQAMMRLGQNGDRVIGTYKPGNGRIEGTVKGRILTGTWQQDGESGGFEFAIAPDRNSFAGRYDNGEFWNGERIDSNTFRPTPFTASDTPRNAFRTIVVAGNAAQDGDTGAAIIYEPLLVFEEGAASASDRQERRIDLHELLNMSTFRIADLPGATAADAVTFEVGPAGSDVSFPLTMRRGEDGAWRLVIPTAEKMERSRSRILDDLGFKTYAEYRAARTNSPRGTMRDLLKGAAAWDSGGMERALSAMDLSGIPPALRPINSPLAADHLLQIINRIGYVIWQEIPDDPDRVTPYKHYVHAAGEVAIGPQPGGEAVDWRFTRDTIETAPALFEAIQDMPLAPGLLPPEPFSDFFALRQRVQDVSPVLLERGFLIAHWQWIAIGLGALGALACAIAAGFAVRLLWAIVPDAVTGADLEATRRRKGLVLAARLMAAGGVLFALFSAIGLPTNVLNVLATSAALVMLGGATAGLYTIVGIFGHVFYRQAEQTTGYLDAIVSSLATGIVKIAVVIGGAVIAADLVNIPIEGIVAGLGVGGLALAIAARDTVSNFFGAAVLLADRPFKRGDFIQIEGRSAIVEEVGLRSSRLRLFDDALMIIPNAKVADGTVVNYGRRRKRQILFTVSVTYDTPRDKLDAFVERVRGLLRDFPRADAEYYVGLARFAASALEVDLWCYVWVSNYGDQVEAQHRLIGDITTAARDMGVSFAFPTRTVHVAAGDRAIARDEPRDEAHPQEPAQAAQ